MEREERLVACLMRIGVTNVAARDNIVYAALSSGPGMNSTLKDYVYRGEGNAHIVIALPNERHVIRFRKSLPAEASEDGGRRRVEREVAFARCVALRFLGPYVRVPEIVRYDRKEIVAISDSIRLLRPEKRRGKDIREEYATRYPDYAFIREDWQPVGLGLALRASGSASFCVEIKPKQGYVDRAAELPFGKCPYCLTQYYKLERGDIAFRSRYCPLDLFSGDEGRVEAAIEALFECPQNNLKIFRNGEQVYGEDRPRAELERVCAECFDTTTGLAAQTRRFAKFLRCALLEQHARVAGDDELDGNEPQPAAAAAASDERRCSPPIGGALPRGSVLERIERMQRSSYVDSDVVGRAYAENSEKDGSLDDHSLGDLSTCVDERDPIVVLRSYLTFCTAKDLSIMLAFRRLDPSDIASGSLATARQVITTPEGLYFAATVGVSDLEPKNVGSIERHLRRKIDVLNAAATVLRRSLGNT